ncbi:sigma-70 family RNA polymerase sigma factor [Bradyrhizobium sp. 137]|uniref:sigma-70 family RNA polymerase sigma factor n=2 Tax=unclassified Bradyrhizobium TaxID=2631580 RepID=UPI001FF9A945|nr:sigma-70 family RNA polymerase sigma factor [Bradyrhizobium sp. 137]
MNPNDDRKKFATVVAPYLADAHAFARWLTHNRADAEDVVQEACIRAFRALPRFSGPNARAWLLTIVRNTAFTLLREKKAAALVSLDELSEGDRSIAERGGELDASGSPEAALIAAAEAAKLEMFIAALPPEFREVLVLRDIQGLEYRDIADITGSPIGTVMSRLARARQKLIAGMKEERCS